MQNPSNSLCLPISEGGFRASPASSGHGHTTDPTAPGFNVGSSAAGSGGWQALQEDFRMIFERDPAAHHWLEVLCCYPGFHAIALYRLA
ncbi:MAG TPA: hypothetical protein V6C88_16900, partial [Chroococcidiopsis sp.]